MLVKAFPILKVFSIEEAEMVEDTRGGMTARARKLVALVYRKPHDILPVFTQCLRDAHHGHVADLLEGEGQWFLFFRCCCCCCFWLDG